MNPCHLVTIHLLDSQLIKYKTLLNNKEAELLTFIGSCWYVLPRKVRRASSFARSLWSTCGRILTSNLRNLGYVMSAVACIGHTSGCFKKVAHKTFRNIFTLVESFFREILQICWQFISTYIYQFLLIYFNISSNGVNFSMSTHRFHPVKF